MPQDYPKLFTYLTELEPPADLAARISSRIYRVSARSARLRAVVSGAVSLAALGASVTTGQWLYAGFLHSGFAQFGSLIFSDLGVLATYWQDFILSLTESFPVLRFTAVLGSTFVFLWSLRYLVGGISVLTRRPGPAGTYTIPS
ncbi:MAG: hypothetical protein HY978_04010 [Candidatus Liptonbacteria bacterium]|nr:hypothetical protein [Candidatus Liptonbacteria bacterium]